MFITQLALIHYRGANNLVLPLDQRLNVFYGVNGAGKSTVLDAAVTALSWLVNRLKNERSSGLLIDEKSIANGKSSAQLAITCRTQQQDVYWRLNKSRTGHGGAEVRSDFSALNEEVAKWHRQIVASNEQINLPLFVYYPINRAVLDIPLRIRQRHQFTIFSAYEDALTGAANFRTFFEWFREREDLENEEARGHESNGQRYQDRQLSAVRQALAAFMPSFSQLTVRRNPLRMEVLKNGKPLLVDQLSDGEKCLIALVGDLARRLAIANPMTDRPLAGAAVVLIDEVDLHLHPDWQRGLIQHLQKTFESCQFLLSTHSPHIITNVRPQSLFCLRQAVDGLMFEKPQESYGKNAERVLEDMMGLATTRPDQVQADLTAMFAAISQGELALASQQIGNLRAEIGDDPELGKAEVLIRRMELIGR